MIFCTFVDYLKRRIHCKNSIFFYKESWHDTDISTHTFQYRVKPSMYYYFFLTIKWLFAFLWHLKKIKSSLYLPASDRTLSCAVSFSWDRLIVQIYFLAQPLEEKKFKPNNNNNNGLFLIMRLWVCLCVMPRGADAVVVVSSVKTWDKREWVWAVGRQSWMEKVQRCSHRGSLLGLWKERESAHSELLHHPYVPEVL